MRTRNTLTGGRAAVIASTLLLLAMRLRRRLADNNKKLTLENTKVNKPLNVFSFENPRDKS